VDGTPINGVVALREVLLQRPEAFRTTLTEKLIVFASGQPVTARVTPDTLIRARQTLRFSGQPHWSSIIAGIVRTKNE
jgi:hypothetical protein